MAAPVTDPSAFAGDWRDSMGNNVRVWNSGPATQVSLAKPDGSGKEILLAIKKVGPSAFQCGNYEYDERQSSWQKLVWRDKRYPDRLTVWERVAATGVGVGAALGACGAAAPWPAFANSATASVCGAPPGSFYPQALAVPPHDAWEPQTWHAAPVVVALQQYPGAPLPPPPPQGYGTAAAPPWAAQAQVQGAAPGVWQPVAPALPAAAPAPAPASDDWSHVLNVLAAARDEPATATAAYAPAYAGQAAAASSVVGGDDDEGAATRWSEVLDMLAAAGTNDTGPAGNASASTSAAAGGGQVDMLFSSFGMQQAPAFEQASEEVRAQVLQETLARLLQQKTGAPATGAEAAFSAARAHVVPPPPWAPLPGKNGAAAAPDWQIGGSIAGTLAPRKEAGDHDHVRKVEGPLQKFIRVFGLDKLAADCLNALQDDEVAFVIESVQGRLAYAKNPSAVVMIAIKGVASRVGRRYYGSAQNTELQKLLEAHSSMGESAAKKVAQPLEMILGSPAAEEDEEEGEDDEDEEEEEEAAVDEAEVNPYTGDAVVVDEAAPPAKKPRLAASGAEVAGASPEAEEEAEEDDDGLFFVDTGVG